MSSNPVSTQTKRTVYAPVYTAAYGSSPVLSVSLDEDEEVIWQWTHYANGQSFVTGYEVLKKEHEEAEREAFDIKLALTDWLWGRNKDNEQ